MSDVDSWDIEQTKDLALGNQTVYKVNTGTVYPFTEYNETLDDPSYLNVFDAIKALLSDN